MAANKLKLLLISVRADYGGGPEHIYRLIQSFSDRVDPYVACPCEIPYWARYSTSVGDANMLELPHRRFSLMSLFALVRFIHKKDIRLIHSHGKGAGLYSRMAGRMTSVPCVHTFHGIHIGSYDRLQKWAYVELERGLSAVSSRMISVSYGEASTIRAMNLCPSRKLVVIENGVKVHTRSRSPENRNDPKKKVILMSRFDFPKNSELIIPILDYLRTCGRLKDFQFVFIGTGPGEYQLKLDLQSRGLASFVNFRGPLLDPSSELDNSFCLLSTSRSEGMPLSILEAMAAGIPVVATDVVGNRDAVEHGRTGYLYELSAPYAAGEYLVKLSDDDSLWKTISEASFAKAASRYRVERMVAETEKIYQDVIHEWMH